MRKLDRQNDGLFESLFGALQSSDVIPANIRSLHQYRACAGTTKVLLSDSIVNYNGRTGQFILKLFLLGVVAVLVGAAAFLVVLAILATVLTFGNWALFALPQMLFQFFGALQVSGALGTNRFFLLVALRLIYKIGIIYASYFAMLFAEQV